MPAIDHKELLTVFVQKIEREIARSFVRVHRDDVNDETLLRRRLKYRFFRLDRGNAQRPASWSGFHEPHRCRVDQVQSLFLIKLNDRLGFSVGNYWPACNKQTLEQSDTTEGN